MSGSTPAPTPALVYKVFDGSDFDAARRTGKFGGAAVDRADGFIHLSTAGQLRETLRLHFAGRRDLVLAALRTADIAPGLRWEPSRGGALFPHLYGELDMEALAWSEPIDVDDRGGCELPARLG